MDPRERFAELEEALRVAMRGNQLALWTALPGSIVSFDPVTVTAVVQPALQGVVRAVDGSASAVNLPLLPDVPVVFPRGGGATLTFPIAKDDECLVVFSSRCIDAWWQSGGVQLPMEPRLHDLSDGFCLVGPQSQVRKISDISTTTVQLRSDDGEAFIELDPNTHDVNVVTPGDLTVNARGADLVLSGDLTAETAGDISITGGGALTANVTGAATLTASGITLNGPVTINGSTQFNGTVNGTGTATFPNVIGGGTNLHTHIHTLTQPGMGNGGPPL